jgi:hypothetical protein
VHEQKPSDTDNKGFARETRQVVEEALRDLSGPGKEGVSAEPVIEFVFIMDRTGFVLTHWTGKPMGGPERLADAVSAIEDFAAKNPGTKEGEIFFIKFQQATILVEPFDRFLVAAVVHGPESKPMYRNLHRQFKAVLDTHGAALRQSDASGKVPGLAQRLEEVFGPAVQTAPDKKPGEGQSTGNIDEVIDAIMDKAPAAQKEARQKYTSAEILKVLGSLPRGLPSSLWGKSNEELSMQVSAAQYAKGEDGEIILRLGNRWYFGDPLKTATFLQEYRGAVRPVPIFIVEEMDERKGFIHEMIRATAKKMKNEGYNVTSLERALDADAELALLALEKFNGDSLFLRALETRVNQLDTGGFEKDVAVIKRNLKDPSHVALTEKAVVELSTRIHEKAEKDAAVIERRIKRASAFIKNLKEEADAIAARGYDMGLFDRALKTNDPELLENLLSAIKPAIVKIEAVRARLKPLDTSSHNSRVQSILAKAAHPSMSDIVEQEFLVLLSEMTDEQKRHAEFENLEEKLLEWQDQGIEVESLVGSLTQDPKQIRNAFLEFEKNVGRLQKLKEQLSGLDGTGLEQLVLDLRAMMNNPANISKIEAGIADLGDRIDQRDRAKQKRKQLTEKMERWRGEGYAVHPLEKILGAEIGTIESEFETFEKNIATLKDMEAQLVKLDTEGFENLVKQIMLFLREPDEADEAANLLDLLRTNIEQRDNMLRQPAFPVKDPKDLVPAIEKCKHLPSFLWGRPHLKMAHIILESELDESKNLELLVKLGNKWYFSDPNKPDRFLKPFYGERVTKEEKRQLVIKSFQS